jgi:hypothetical protein
MRHLNESVIESADLNRRTGAVNARNSTGAF